MTTSLSTGGGPVSYVQLSEGGFQVVYPLGLWSRFSGVVSQSRTWIWLGNYLHLHMGVKRTISLVTGAFYWPGITTDIKNFVSQCR